MSVITQKIDGISLQFEMIFLSLSLWRKNPSSISSALLNRRRGTTAYYKGSELAAGEQQLLLYAKYDNFVIITYSFSLISL